MAEKLWNGISGQEFVASRAHKDADGNIIDTTYATKYELSAAISSIPAGAQADWNQTDDTAPDYIKNKPVLEAGEGIDITENGNTLVFSVSGDYMTSADISDLSAAISGKVDSTTFNNTISELEGSINDVENIVSDLSGAITDKVDTETFNDMVTEIDNNFATVDNDINYLSGAISGKVDSTTFDNAISEIDSSFADVENEVNYLSSAISNKVDTETFNNKVTEIDNEFSAVENDVNYLFGAITDKVDQEVFDNTVAGINSDINYLSGAISSMPTGQVQADWTETDTTSPAYIRNKPTSFDNIQGGDGIEITKEQDTTIISVSADYATEQYVDTGLAMKMDNSMSGDFYPMDTNPSGYLTSNSLDDYATKDYVIFNTSGKVDTDVFDSTISNIDDNFTIVENDINYLSGSIVDKVDNDTFEDVVSDIDSSFGLVENDINYLSAAISSMPDQVQADWNQTDDTEPDYIKNKPVMEAGEGIDITENGNTLVFSVSGDYATSTDISELSYKIDDKLDISAFNNKVSEIDNNFIVVESDIDDLSGAISDKVDVNTFDDAITDIANSFNDIASDINYLSGAVSNKVDSEVFDSVITEIDNSFNEVENDVNYLSGAITDKVDTNVFNDTISEIDSCITSIENDVGEMSAVIANKVDTNVFNDTVTEIDNSFGVVEDDINYLSAAISSMPEQVQSDWTETDITNPAYIQNKPEPLAITEGSGIKIVENQNNIEISVSADYAYTSDVNAAIDAVEDMIDIVSGAIDDINTDLQNYVSATEFAEVTAVIPSDATSQNQLVSMDTLDSKIADFGGFKVVSANQQGEPDVSNPKTNIIYLTQDPSVVGKDQFKEWIWDSNAPAASAWKLVGDTSIDLEGYVKAPQSYTPYHIVSIVDNNTLFDTGLTTATITNTRADWNNTDPNSYAYIQNKPSIPEAQVQADWNMADSADISYIKNKPTSLSIQGGEGIDVSENQDALVIAVSADYATENYVDTALDSKLDVSMSAEFYPMNTNPAGYVTSADLNYYATETYVDAAVSGKVDAIVGMGLSHEDFTSAYKEKLDSISPSAEANVQADWSETDSTADSYIRNKPTSLSIEGGDGIEVSENQDALVIAVSADYATEDYVISSVSGKVDKVLGYGLSKNDFTDALFDKLNDIAPSAEVNVQADWTETNSASDAYIANKPEPLGIRAGEGIDITEDQNDIVISVSADYATEDYVIGSVSGKVDKVQGYGLSEEDFTTVYKEKLDDIEPSANVNVQADWSETDPTLDSYILNKPQALSIEGGDGIEVSESQGNLVIAVSADYATYAWTNTQLADKTDKVIGATAGNFAGLDISGNLTDSTYKASDFATSAQGAKADTAVQDANYVHTDNNYTTTEKNLLASLDTAVSGIEDTIPSNASSLNQLVTRSDLDAAATGAFEIVPLDANDQPDVANPNGKVIYLTKESGSTKTDPYTEWIWLSGTSAFEVIGETSIDLTNYATLTDLSGKVDKVTGYGLSKNDFTDALLDKLTDIAPSAEVNVQADWAESNSASDAYIQNKPDVLIPQAGPGVSAVPKYVMVVSAMPAAAAIDPYTIYLVQGTYIGT